MELAGYLVNAVVLEHRPVAEVARATGSRATAGAGLGLSARVAGPGLVPGRPGPRRCARPCGGRCRSLLAPPNLLCRTCQKPAVGTSDYSDSGARASFQPHHCEARSVGSSLISQAATAGRRFREPAHRSSRRYGSNRNALVDTQSDGSWRFPRRKSGLRWNANRPHTLCKRSGMSRAVQENACPPWFS